MLTLDKIYYAAFVLKYVARKTVLIAEGTGAVAVAAVMFDKVDLTDKKAVCLVSGGNVVSVHHDRSDASMAITSGFLKLGLETRDLAQIQQIRQELTKAGFHLVNERA